jgi:transcriptional regulator with XRE-family HTH domain
VLDTEALLKARRAKNLSREKLAALVGRSLSTVNRWEAGTSQPDTEDLGALVRVLGLSTPATLLKCY